MFPCKPTIYSIYINRFPSDADKFHQIPSDSQPARVFQVRRCLGTTPRGLPAAGGPARDPRGRDAGIGGHPQGAQSGKTMEKHGENIEKTWKKCLKNHNFNGKRCETRNAIKYVQVCGDGLL